MKPRVYSIEEVKARLLQRLPALLSTLLPNGQKRGNEWVALNPGRADHTLGSLSVNMATGLWRDFASNDKKDGGDVLQLVVSFAAAGDAKRGWRWAMDWLGLSGHAPDPAKVKAYEEAAKKTRAQHEEQRERLRAAAWRTMRDAVPLTGEDPASLYLRARAIDVRQLKDGIPRALRFHPACYVDKDNALPALLAFMTLDSAARGFCGIHRIWLKQENGIWTKAFSGDAAKKSLGTKSGATVRLTRGASGKALKDAPAGEWICLTEGIEDGLSIALARPELRVLVSTTVSKLGTVALPEQLGGIYLFAQNDPIGSRADEAVQSAALALRQRYKVKVVRLPRTLAKDPNEALQKMQQQQGAA